MILTLGTTPAVQRSMVFDRLVLDGVNRTHDVQQYASGKSINAARVLKTLGNDVSCTGFVGGDSGEFLLDDLDKSDIAHSFIRVEQSTRLCITLIDRGNSAATELIEESQPVAEHVYDQLLAKLRELLPDASAVLLCGSLPPDAPQDFYARCVNAAVSTGKLVLLDATGLPLQLALASRPTIIKPNRQELSQTVKVAVESDLELKSAIAALIAMGPQWAVVTNGSKDTVASDGKSFWRISSPKIEVVSAIGSGDAFAAGLIAGISTGQTIPHACQLAAACGAANAMTSMAGHVNPGDVNRLLKDVSISEF